MYIVKEQEKACCTCSHWFGVRAMEENGFVYSLENLEGMCKGARSVAGGSESDIALTFPDSCCKEWDQWPDILS